MSTRTEQRPPSSGSASSQQAAVAKKASSSSTRKVSDKYEGNPDHNLPGIGNYIFVKTVGEGNFAKVKLAKHKLTSQEVAIKIIDKTKLDEKKLSKLYREVRIMKLLHHPHIVKLYEVIETKSTVFLVMEYASGGELYDYLVVHGRMKEKEARAKFRQILSAVSYCHKKRVIHRDLKAENLLLDANMNIKIADFGFSNYYDPDDKLDTFCGSPPYAAPELFQGRRYTGPEVDVWSLGVILYVLTTGCLPFDGKNLQEMRESVCRGKYRVPFYLSDGCEKLLRKFLVRDPSKRASLDIVVDDIWINDSYPDSPITQDLGTKIEEDDEIIAIMERKFGIERDQAVRALRENIYDDVAAVYHLLYHERETYRMQGEAHPASNDNRNGSNSNTSNSNDDSRSSEPPIASSAPADASPLFSAVQPSYGGGNNNNNNSANSNNGGTSANGRISGNGAPSSTAQEAPDAAGGEEDADTFPAGAAGAGGAAAAAAAARKKAPRRRRFTVGGEADVVKYVDDEESLKAAEALKLKVPGGGGGENGGGNVPQVVTEDTSSQHSMTPSVASSQRKNSITDDGGEEGGNGESRRKRHNTFVGIFRNSIRKQSDAGTAASAAAAVAAAAAAAAAASSNQAPSITSASGSASGSVLISGTIAGPGEEGKPRSLRFTFNSNSTSSKPPDEVVKEVTDALKLHNVQYTMAGRYLINCSAQHGALKFEIEICKLPRLRNLHGLRFKRMAGQSADYKDICEKVLATVKL